MYENLKKVKKLEMLKYYDNVNNGNDWYNLNDYNK